MKKSRNEIHTNTSKDRLLDYASAIAEACELLMQRDDKVFVFGLDVDDHKAINGSTAGLRDKFGDERIFSTPLSEDAMTGVAVGAAMAGYRPIHVHIRMDFLLLTMNQLINMAAKAYYMYNGQVSVPMVVRAIVGRSWGQGAQHSQALHSLFMHIPGLKVVAPSNAYDAKGALISSVIDNNPVIFMEHRLLYGMESYVPKDFYCLPLGKGRIMRSGDDITIVGISHMVIESLRAAKLLENVSIMAEVIDPISLRPLDIDIICDSYKKTKKLLVVDNGWLMCGASAEIITQIIERLPNGVNGEMHAIQRLGFADVPCPTTKSLENLFYPDAISIANKVLCIMGREVDLCSVNENTEIDEFKGPF